MKLFEQLVREVIIAYLTMLSFFYISGTMCPHLIIYNVYLVIYFIFSSHSGILDARTALCKVKS